MVFWNVTPCNLTKVLMVTILKISTTVVLIIIVVGTQSNGIRLDTNTVALRTLYATLITRSYKYKIVPVLN